jgi:hypothetical protein
MVMTHRASRPNADDQISVELVQWRRRLENAGFEPSLAQTLAADRRFDLHTVLELLDRGCPPELAARILAPLEDPHEERD